MIRASVVYGSSPDATELAAVGVTYELAAVDVSWVLISVTAETAETGVVFYKYKDTAVITEDLAADFVKSLSEAVTVVDIFDIFEQTINTAYQETGAAIDVITLETLFPRALDDVGAVFDSSYRGVGKGFLDTAFSAEDITALQKGKAYTEVPVASIQAIFDVSAPRIDHTLAVETLQRVAAYLRENSEFTSAQDAFSKLFTINKFDSVSVGESIDVLRAAVAAVDDSVFATDDVDGEASILDDQTLQLFKGISELPKVLDTLERVSQYSRLFTDQAIFSDVYEVVLAPKYAEFASATDETPLGVLKALSEGLGAAYGAVADLVGLVSGLSKSDTTYVAQLFVLAYIKPLSDSALSVEFAVKSGEKVRSDSVSCSANGTLLNQDYVSDPFYFADDYVGAKRAL